jgi:hypothetical protein
MFYEEKIIDGVMHWRSDPNDDFKPYTLEELSLQYQAAIRELNRLLTNKAERDAA